MAGVLAESQEITASKLPTVQDEFCTENADDVRDAIAIGDYVLCIRTENGIRVCPVTFSIQYGDSVLIVGYPAKVLRLSDGIRNGDSVLFFNGIAAKPEDPTSTRLLQSDTHVEIIHFLFAAQEITLRILVRHVTAYLINWGDESESIYVKCPAFETHVRHKACTGSVLSDISVTFFHGNGDTYIRRVSVFSKQSISSYRD